MRHEQQLVDRKIKEITNDLGYKRFRGQKIDEDYERRKPYEEEKYAAARRYMLSIPFVDEDDYIPKAITPDLPSKEPEDSLIMEDEHLDTIPKKDFGMLWWEGVGGIHKIERLESLLNRDSPIDSTKIDSIFDEFSLPRPPEESNSENSNITIESLSPSPIPVEDSDPFMEEIDIFLASDDSTPPGVESDYDSEVDILLLEGLLNNDLVPLAEYHHFTFDVEPDPSVKNDFDELNEDECFDPGGGENVVFLNVEEDDSFTFTIRTFLPFVTYPEVSPLLSSTKNEDTIFDPGIST
ncbi:hypothetical protein Tco_0014253 [Tanacetum coccineum]